MPIMGELQLIWTGLKRWLPQALESVQRLNSRVVLFWIGLILTGFVLWQVLFVIAPAIAFKAKMAECKQNLHAVQLGLERFSVDAPGSIYPLDLTALIEQSYLREMPLNPFTGEPMRWVVLTELDLDASMPLGLSHGDFGYYPRPEKEYMTHPLDLNKLKHVDIHGYTLVLY